VSSDGSENGLHAVDEALSLMGPDDKLHIVQARPGRIRFHSVLHRKSSLYMAVLRGRAGRAGAFNTQKTAVSGPGSTPRPPERLVR
jgi:hypothetical protein